MIQNSKGYFLFSEAPLRVLGLNQRLFGILKDLQNGREFTDLAHSAGLAEGRLMGILLGLTARGYLVLDKLPDPVEFPTVSIIIPAKNSLPDLSECLASVVRLDYPSEKLELIVVDDGSIPPASEAISNFPVKVLRNERSLGPAAARNLGAAQAGGRYLAFLDADCVASPEWLRELVPFFAVEKLGAVGGLVESFRQDKWLDRYEAVSSSLNMGKRVLFHNEKSSTFYAPTCNFLVDGGVFLAEEGFKAGMYLGEDVDFCWRMRSAGRGLLYLPQGKIFHKHRNQLSRMLKRRFAYGTSEAPLYQAHPEKRKVFPLPVGMSLALLALLVAILLLNPFPLAALPVFVGIDIALKNANLRRHDLRESTLKIAGSSLRALLSMAYFACFHLCRYYLILLLLLGIAWHPIWIFCALALLLVSIVDYVVKKPRLVYPVFLAFYLLEHLSYQLGVLWGCIRQKSLRSYAVNFRVSGAGIGA